jgi:hypothetical protein
MPPRPLLVIAATGLDALRLEHATTTELLDDDELLQAAQRAGLAQFDLAGADTERIRGALTALRGSVGEHWVLDRLRTRQLPVPDSTTSVEMLAFTTPGIDLVFSDAAGATTGAANVKIAATADVVLRHFEQHPDVGLVYATSDAATDAAARGLQVLQPGGSIPEHGPVVVDIGRTSSEFDQQIGATLDRHGDALSASADALDIAELVPWASTAAIAVRALLRLRAGVARQDVVRHAAREATAAGTATAAAHTSSQLTAPEAVVALAAMVTSAVTFGALDVRRSWTTLTDQLAHLTAVAELVSTSHRATSGE